MGRPSGEILQRVLQGLDSAERDRIENLPPEKRQEELTRKFYSQFRNRGFKGPFGSFPSPGGKRPNEPPPK